MAYGNQSGNKPAFTPNRTSAPVAARNVQADADKGIILSTGMFKPEKGVAIASIRLKETVTLEAGDYVNVYHNAEKKSDKSPDFRLQVKRLNKKA